MKVQPSELVELGNDALAASQALGSAWTDAVSGMQLRSSVAGNIVGADALVEAHTQVTGSADLAIGLLAGTLEQNMDDLYAVAFDMSTTDESVAQQFESQYPQPAPPTPGPAPSPTPQPSPTPPTP